MILLFPVFINLIRDIWEPVQGFIQTHIADVGKSKEELQLSLFHTVFNVINTALMIGFVPLIARVVTKLVPSKGEEDEEYSLAYIGSGMMLSTEASIFETKKELLEFSTRVKKMTGFIPQLMVETDKKKFKKLTNKVRKYEEFTDRIEKEIANYLTKVSEGTLIERSSVQIRSMLSIASDLEIIGDINYQMSKALQRKREEKVWFTPEQRENLKEMFQLLEEALEIMLRNQKGFFNHSMLEEAYVAEKNINKKRNEIRKEHLKSIEKGEYSFQSGMIYKDLFSSIEKVGDQFKVVGTEIKGG